MTGSALSPRRPRLRSATPRPPARATQLPQRHIHVDALRVGLFGTLGVGIGLVILGAASALGTVFIYIGVAFFISLAVEPLIQWGLKRRIPRWVSSISLALIAVGVIVLVTVTVVPTVIRQVASFASSVPGFASGLLKEPWAVWLSNEFGDWVDLDSFITSVTSFITNPEQLLSVGGGLLAIGSGIAGGVTAIIVVTVLTLYFILTLPLVLQTAYKAVPRSKRAGFISVTEEILQSVGKYVAGQLLLAVANSVVTFAVVSLVGGPAPLLLAFIAFVCALIPVVGPIIGTTIVVLATLTVNPWGALIAGVIMLVYMQVEAYLLSPRVMAKAVAVPGALVIVAAIGGAALGGVLGALVAIPVVASGILIFQRVVVPRQEQL